MDKYYSVRGSRAGIYRVITSMSPFLIIVQTGLLLHAISFNGNMSFSEKLLNAMGDAIRLNQLFEQDGIEAGIIFGKDFVKWATLGTEYAWIKAKLGARNLRPY